MRSWVSTYSWWWGLGWAGRYGTSITKLGFHPFGNNFIGQKQRMVYHCYKCCCELTRNWAWIFSSRWIRFSKNTWRQQLEREIFENKGEERTQDLETLAPGEIHCKPLSQEWSSRIGCQAQSNPRFWCTPVHADTPPHSLKKLAIKLSGPPSFWGFPYQWQRTELPLCDRKEISGSVAPGSRN